MKSSNCTVCDITWGLFLTLRACIGIMQQTCKSDPKRQTDGRSPWSAKCACASPRGKTIRTCFFFLVPSLFSSLPYIFCSIPLCLSSLDSRRDSWHWFPSPFLSTCAGRGRISILDLARPHGRQLRPVHLRRFNDDGRKHIAHKDEGHAIEQWWKGSVRSVRRRRPLWRIGASDSILMITRSK